jgi:hypothetical protein
MSTKFSIFLVDEDDAAALSACAAAVARLNADAGEAVAVVLPDTNTVPPSGVNDLTAPFTPRSYSMAWVPAVQKYFTSDPWFASNLVPALTSQLGPDANYTTVTINGVPSPTTGKPTGDPVTAGSPSQPPTITYS